MQKGKISLSDVQKYEFISVKKGKKVLLITLLYLLKDNEDWQEGKHLKECNLYMLTYEIDCDVTFLVGDTKEAVRCHKYVLASRNSKFSRILHRFRGETDILLSIPDIQRDVFKELIK